MRKRILLTMTLCIGLIIIAISIVPSICFACKCVEPDVAEVELEESQAVFSGKVMDVVVQKSLMGSTSKRILFEVKNTWKGVSESQVIVVTGQGGGDCGFNFIEGEDYLVYANPSSLYEDSNHLSVGICSRTNELSEAEEDLHVLGEGKAPTKVVDLGKESNGTSLYIWVIAVGIIGVVAFFIWRRFRK